MANELQIADASNEVRARFGRMAGVPKALIIHHTGGRGDVHGVTNTFNQRQFPAHYVIDRDGQIWKTLPDGEIGHHIRNSPNSHLSNEDTIGVEVIGNDDRDITPQQIEAAKQLHGHLSQRYPGLQVYGHGEINAHKMIDEGHRIAMELRGGKESGLPPIPGDHRVPYAPTTPSARTLTAYMQTQQQDRPAGFAQNAIMHRMDNRAPAAAPSPSGGFTQPSNDEVRNYIATEAAKRGMDPQVALKVWQAEGGSNWTGDQNSSHGPFQLHYGGVAGGRNAVPGMGDDFTKATGLDARNPATWKEQTQFALDQAKQGGWGPWHGWHGDKWAGINRGTRVASNGPAPVGPAPVQAAAATPQQAAKPTLSPEAPQPPRRPMMAQAMPPAAPQPPRRPELAQPAPVAAKPIPPGSVLNDIDKRDPSGLLKSQQTSQLTPAQMTPRMMSPEPVKAAAATPAQVAKPDLSPSLRSPETALALPASMGGSTPKQISPASLQAAPLQHPLGIYHGAPGGPIDMARPQMPGMARDLTPPGNAPLPVAQLPATQTIPPAPPPEMRPLGTPINGGEQLAPIRQQMTTPQPSTPVSDPTPATPAAPADTTPPGPESPPTPTETPEGPEGGGGGSMLAGLAEALSNLGGGGGGGGEQQPQAAPPPAPLAIPDFPDADLGISNMIAQKGMQSTQPAVPQLASMFKMPEIGKQSQPVPVQEGFARSPLKRLFT